MSDLSVNVNDTVKTSEVMGQQPPLEAMFQNPKGDPNVAGLCKVKDIETLTHIAPLAFDFSKQKGKPVIIIVFPQ